MKEIVEHLEKIACDLIVLRIECSDDDYDWYKIDNAITDLHDI